MPPVRTIHQPGNILGNLLLLIKKPLSSDKPVVQRHMKSSFGGDKHDGRLLVVNMLQVTLKVYILLNGWVKMIAE